MIYKYNFFFSPLEGVEESMSYFDVPHRPQTTPRKRPVSVLALNGELVSLF